MRVWRAFTKWGWILLVAVGALLAWVFLRRNPLEVVVAELKTVDAGEKARLLAAELGHAKAVAEIEREHAGTIAKLDDKGRARAEELRGDPVALARALSRLSGKS